jgi:hypothetical protein
VRRVDLIADQDPATGQVSVPLWAGPLGWISLVLFGVHPDQCEWPRGRLRVLEAFGMRPPVAEVPMLFDEV